MQTQGMSGADFIANGMGDADMGVMDDLVRLIKENPELPVVPMVHSHVVGDWDDATYWLGKFDLVEVGEYYIGRDRVHVNYVDDEEDVLADMVGCEPYKTPDGRSIYEISEDEWDRLFAKIPWTRAIIVYIEETDAAYEW